MTAVPNSSPAPVGQQGPPARAASHEGTPRRARVPPIDYRDLSPCLTSKEETDITTIIQRRPQHPRRSGRDQSEQLVAIRRNEWSRSSECWRVQIGPASRTWPKLGAGPI
jgi:hypothetical protein